MKVFIKIYTLIYIWVKNLGIEKYLTKQSTYIYSLRVKYLKTLYFAKEKDKVLTFCLPSLNKNIIYTQKKETKS